MVDIRGAVRLFLVAMRDVVALLGRRVTFAELEEGVWQVSARLTLGLLELVFAALDERLMRERDRGRYVPLGMRVRELDTPLGTLRLRRRYYRDRQTGQGVFLLDRALGLGRGQRWSPRLAALCTRLATELPYHRAAAVLRELTPGRVSVPAMAVWRAAQRAGERLEEAAEARRRAVFDEGQDPGGRRRCARLHVEADELYVRGRGRPVMVRLGVAYEGKREVARGRVALEGRQVVAGVVGSRAFWEQAYAAWGQRWDLSAVEAWYVGGDGASWIRRGLQYVPRACYRLDPFHLRRAVREALSPSEPAYGAVWEALAAGDWAGVESALREACRRRSGAGRARVLRLWGYLREQWEGIVASGDVPSLGAAEAMVFHVAARRMKRHGARWSARGADRLARLLSARVNGEEPPVGERMVLGPAVRATARAVVRQLLRAGQEDPAAWLRAHLPALEGPHADRHWVQILRELSRVQAPGA